MLFSSVAQSCPTLCNPKIISKLWESWKNSKNNVCISFTQILNLLTFHCITALFSFSFYNVSVCVCKLIIISFYEPPEYKLQMCCFIPSKFSCISPNKNSLLCNHHTTLQVRTSTLVQHYLTYRSCPNRWVLTASRTGTEFCYQVSFNME